MLTSETRAVFARDRAAIADNTWFTPEQRAVFVASDAKRHAEYETRFTALSAALHAMDGRPLMVALDLLGRLGEKGALSGSYEFRVILDRLSALGLPDANYLFSHDRLALVDAFGGRRAA